MFEVLIIDGHEPSVPGITPPDAVKNIHVHTITRKSDKTEISLTAIHFYENILIICYKKQLNL